MSALLLAPVWSIEWKIALIVLLGIAVLICALLIAYAVVMYRRRENRTPEDEFQIADDGGFGKIVNVNDEVKIIQTKLICLNKWETPHLWGQIAEEDKKTLCQEEWICLDYCNLIDNL